MDLQLNAADSDASGGEPSPSTAPPAFAMSVSRISASGGVSLSSILSAESPQTPQDAPRFELPIARHAGLASLMNSPLPDAREPPRFPTHDAAAVEEERDVVHVEVHAPPPHDVEMAEREDGEEGEEPDESPVKRRRGQSVASEGSVSTPPPATVAVQSPASVAVHTDSLVLEDADLESLKAALQTAIQKFLSAEAKASAPPAKRRKGKQPQKKRASQAAEASTAVGDSLEDVEQCIAKIHDKITVDLMEVAVLRDVLRLSLTFLGIVNAADSVETSSPPDCKVAISSLQQKPVHLQLASAIRRVMLSVPDDAIPLIFSDVFEWIVASGEDAVTWSWLFVFFAQFDSPAVVDFFMHYAVFQVSGGENGNEMQLTVSVLEHLAKERGAEIVAAVTKIFKELSSGRDAHKVPVEVALVRIVSLAMRSTVLLHAVDDSFQWIMTKELVVCLWNNTVEDPNGTTNGADHHHGSSIFSSLLALLDERSSALENSTFQSLILLQQLTAWQDRTVPQELAKLAGKFHTDVLRVAQNQAKMTVLRNLHRRIGYITQTTVELLREERDGTLEGSSLARFDSWKSWLVAIATSISRQEVTDLLLQADLTLHKLSTSAESQRNGVDSLADLLCTIVEPSSSEFVILLREITTRMKNPAVCSSGRHRLLLLLERLIDRSAGENTSSSRLPLKLPGPDAVEDVDTLIESFSRMTSCQDSWVELERWRAASGADLWEYLVDLVAGDGSDLAIQALELLAKTPFPSLENPTWQFRCIRKLSNVYFYTLRRYRSSAIDLDLPREHRNEYRRQLRVVRSIIRRVLSLDGAVALYLSSVCSQFTSLWLDLLFSTASATSVPTHFPSSTKGDAILSKKTKEESGRRGSIGEDHVVIRSERTISSKCTNLQSSQVITRHSDTLVYRKALDETWEREMNAALSCSLLATNVLAEVLNARNPDVEGDKRERRMKVMVNMLLERALPCCGIPSDDVYKEILPNRSSFDMDLRVEQWLNHFPAFLPLLRLVIEQAAELPTPAQALRLVPVIKSALVVLIGHWNSVKGDLDVENMDVPPYMRNRNQLALSCELVRILRLSGWIPMALAKTAELLPLTTPADIRGILFSCWFFIADHPPTSTSPSTNPPTTASPSKMPIEFYLLPVRQALHRNIHRVGAKYAKFMC